MGILYDKYDDEDELGHYHGSWKVQLVFPNRTEKEKTALDGEVVTYRLKDKQ